MPNLLERSDFLLTFLMLFKQTLGHTMTLKSRFRFSMLCSSLYIVCDASKHEGLVEERKQAAEVLFALREMRDALQRDISQRQVLFF